MVLHLHPLPGDENRYSPDEFERDVKPHIKFGPDPSYVRLPRVAKPAWLKHNPVKITEKLYEPPASNLRMWGEPTSGFTPYPRGDADAGPSELHILQWEDEPPTLWQRFTAWLKGE